MNKNWLFIIFTLLYAFVTPLGYSVQNPSLNNPAGATTTPQSYYGNSLVNTSNPVDTSGNQIVTGNVRHGMSFQGNVPYSSPSSFNSNLGSASLNSFMRDSTGSEDVGRYQNTSTAGSVSGTNYQPYHLPSATVTTTSPNRSGAIGQVNTSANNNAQYIAGSQTQQNQPAISTQSTSAPAPTFWQLYNPGLAGTQTQYNSLSEPRQISQSPRQNQARSPNQNPIYQQDQSAVSQQYLQQDQQNTNQSRWDQPQFSDNRMTTQEPVMTQQNLQQAPSPINQEQQTQTIPRYSPTQPVPAVTQQQMTANGEIIPAREQYTSVPYQPGNTQQPVSANNTAYSSYTGQQQMGTQQYQQQGGRIPNTAPDIETTRAIAQIQKQLDDLIRSIDSRLQNPTDYTSQYSTTVQEISSQRQTGNSYQPGQMNQDFSIPTGNPQEDTLRRSRLQDIMKSPDGSQTQSSQNQMSPLGQFNQLSQAEVSARAKQIMGPHMDYESYSQAKYSQLYRAAEGHLNIGRFRQAADAYTLAAIYNPDDPLCYAGRGHALFAAGEFISSALFLIRAIEIDPEYVSTNIDLVELLGNAEDLNTKITELNKWLQKSNAPGLGFLLGYVYYHTGRLNEAKQVMDIVSHELPQSRAAMALKMAIDFKLKTKK